MTIDTDQRDQLRRAVALYCHGPASTRGDWPAACKQAGYKRIPTKMSEGAKRLVRKLGGPEPFDDEPSEVPEALPATLPTFGVPELPAEDAGQSEWQRLAEDVREEYKLIALGKKDASPTQRQAIEHIFARAWGKPGQQQAEDTAQAVVVLPTLGEGANTHVCPVCAYQLGMTRAEIEPLLQQIDDAAQ